MTNHPQTMSPTSLRQATSVTLAEWLLTCIVGLGLSLSVWWGLATGGGLVGGDTYPYFMPQKIILADSFAAGKTPLWHNLTGLGYPLHAESQAAVFYPTNQILYRLLDINTAYNASIILHYWLAFVFAWRFARAERISTWPAMLAALIFVYGWFPARVSLEWSIIGGVWFPLTLWLTRELVDHPTRRRFALLAICLGIHLLAGHFTLAFINQLTIVLYASLRLSLQAGDTAATNAQRSRKLAYIVLAVAAGIALAAAQLIPTYELKSNSQREDGNKAFSAAYGHMPPLYATQVVASWWYWHSPEVRASREILRSPGAIDADTNAVEAHLYWGLLPLCLIFCTLSKPVRKQFDPIALRSWGILSLFGVVYATGWLLPVTRHLPGFSFFMGPGRYTIICSIGGSLVAAMTLDILLRKSSRISAAVITVVFAAITLQDLLWSSRYIADAVIVRQAPISKLEKSWIRKTFTGKAANSRLLAPGPNVGNLFGVSCVPQYLGLGPSIYYDDALRPPTGPPDPSKVFPDKQTLHQLDALGVTHILTTEPLRHPANTLRIVGQFPDALLNAVWGRGTQPCHLYKMIPAPGRVAAIPPSALVGYEFVSSTADSFEFTVELSEDADVVLKELMFPGWQVTVDGKKSLGKATELSMRSTRVSSGSHTIRWAYQPQSFRVGQLIAFFVASVLIMMLVVPRRLTPSSSSENEHLEGCPQPPKPVIPPHGR